MSGDEMVLVSAAALRTVLSQHTTHAHRRPGIWDSDNRPGLANTRCVECDARDRLIAALRALDVQLPAEERSEEATKKPAACPECGLNPIADGYSVCEVCAFRPGRSGEEKPA